MLRILLVGLAGLAGTLCRYWLSGVVVRRYGEAFPLGTLAVTLSGCLDPGLPFYFMQEHNAFSETARAAVFVGLLGGFTTFSAYGLQSFVLLGEGGGGRGGRHAAAS